MDVPKEEKTLGIFVRFLATRFLATRFLATKFLGTLVPSILLLIFPWTAFAATMYPSPSSGSKTVGESFTVGVYVSSPDQPLNAVSGSLSFSTEQLEATSVTTGGSIIGLWVQTPTYSNTTGTVTFEGIVFNPGYTGSAGNLFTVTFKPKSAGSANVSFSSGQVLANDGQGTNILKGLGTGTYTINVVSQTTSTTPTVITTPKITSRPLTQTTAEEIPVPDPVSEVVVEELIEVEIPVVPEPVVAPTILVEDIVVSESSVSVRAILFALTLFIIAIFLFSSGKFFGKRQHHHVRGKGISSEDLRDIHKRFEVLHRDLRLARPLTKTEDHLIKKIRKDLEATEQAVLEDIL